MLRSYLLAVCLSLLPMSAIAESTRIEVAVLSQGGKLIGDKTGGAQVTLVDEESGELLVEGITRGGTGSTERIMAGEGGIHRDISAEGDAVFATSLELNEPRRVTVITSGPLDHPQSMSTASETRWLLPGHDLVDATRIRLTLAGYVVEPVETAINDQGTGRLSVDLQLLCGCPITPGGTWDADRIRMRASLHGQGDAREEAALEYSGEGTVYVARFAGKVKRPRSVRVDLAGMDDGNTASLVLPLMQ